MLLGSIPVKSVSASMLAPAASSNQSTQEPTHHLNTAPPHHRSMGRIPEAMGPCGVYCGACPAFDRTCLGCGSDDRQQKRSSKFSCKLRRCAFEEKDVDLCNECPEFPCKKLLDKLPRAHPGDPRFEYRVEVLENAERIRQVGVERWLEEQDARWTCPQCGGRVHFYHYRCSQCGIEVSV